MMINALSDLHPGFSGMRAPCNDADVLVLAAAIAPSRSCIRSRGHIRAGVAGNPDADLDHAANMDTDGLCPIECVASSWES